MEKKEIKSYYTERINALSAELESRKARVKYFITAEISLFVIGVGMGVAYFSGYIPTMADMDYIPVFSFPSPFLYKTSLLIDPVISGKCEHCKHIKEIIIISSVSGTKRRIPQTIHTFFHIWPVCR